MTNLSRAYALELDSRDELASFREQFVIADPDLLYVDGNSLGRLPKAAVERARPREQLKKRETTTRLLLSVS